MYNNSLDIFAIIIADKDMKAFEYVGEYAEGGYAVWAPDVIYNEAMGKWVMSFSTSHDWRTSNICRVSPPYETSR